MQLLSACLPLLGAAAWMEAEAVAPLSLCALPPGVLAHIVRCAALSDAGSAVALASCCRLLAQVAASETLVFLPLLQAACNNARLPPPDQLAAFLAASAPRPHARAYRELRRTALLRDNLWRGCGDEQHSLYVFRWVRGLLALECARLHWGAGAGDGAGTPGGAGDGAALHARRVCLVGSSGVESHTLSTLDGDRVALVPVAEHACSPPTVKAHAAAVAVAAVLQGGVSPEAALGHATAQVQSREQQRRRSLQCAVPPPVTFLIRVAALAAPTAFPLGVLHAEGYLLLLAHVGALLVASALAVPGVTAGAVLWEVAASCAPASAGDTMLCADPTLLGVSHGRCRVHAGSCSARVFWLAGGRLAAGCAAGQVRELLPFSAAAITS